ncbi:histidine kinase [Burkholderia oklahomensis]|uniref:histidine kinase n=1 Tax=Burkholderia oklahomensis TaxID=342113 RepID=UPI000A810645|nr:histidine kinase [Burkholderia oklahomensis]
MPFCESQTKSKRNPFKKSTAGRALRQPAGRMTPPYSGDAPKTHSLTRLIRPFSVYPAYLKIPLKSGRALHQKCSCICAASDYIFGKTIKNC